VTCTNCGTELPDGALFCGECGRAVATVARRVERVRVPQVPTSSVERIEPVQPQRDGQFCESCGAAMAPDEVFCGECGAVSKSAAHNLSQPRDTVVIDRLVAEPQSPEPELLPPLPLPLPPEPQPIAVSEPVVERLEAPFADEEDVEATRILGRGPRGERFVLQFSTGESSTVYGTGLIGRNPVPEPGEYFDQLVRVVDPSRSVSKVHLEFGQEAGVFWVMDRFSGNGTVLREPEAAPVRCQPQRRYRIPRGTRVEIGEQFFIVS
jgi:hypothetical protein